MKTDREISDQSGNVKPDFVSFDPTGTLGSSISIEDQVYAAGERLAINIENGRFRECHAEDIVLILTFMKDVFHRINAKNEEREREFEEIVGEVSIAQDKIYRIRLALED